MDLLGISSIVDIGKSILDRVIPDPQQKLEAQLALAKLAQDGEFKAQDAQLQLMLGQIDINKIEAQSESLFKSGWRPAAGWVCVFGFAYTNVVRPLSNGFYALWASSSALSPFPDLDITTLLSLLVPLLGLGAYRTVEKLKGAHI